MPLSCDCYPGCWRAHSEDWPKIVDTDEMVSTCYTLAGRDRCLPYGTFVRVDTNELRIETEPLKRKLLVEYFAGTESSVMRVEELVDAYLKRTAEQQRIPKVQTQRDVLDLKFDLDPRDLQPTPKLSEEDAAKIRATVEEAEREPLRPVVVNGQRMHVPFIEFSHERCCQLAGMPVRSSARVTYDVPGGESGTLAHDSVLCVPRDRELRINVT